ncbi:MAG: hypothetical protein AVDCRST_MAG87-730, partial [uncultured Thermomicrobiales bacterium]
ADGSDIAHIRDRGHPVDCGAGAEPDLHHHPRHRSGTAGRGSVRARRGNRDADPCCRRRARAQRGGRIVRSALRRREICRSGLPHLARRGQHPLAPRRSHGPRRGPYVEPGAAVFARHHHQRAQPEGRHLLPGVPAAIPRSVPGQHVAPDPDP